jgi:hypothetical protein
MATTRRQLKTDVQKRGQSQPQGSKRGERVAAEKRSGDGAQSGVKQSARLAGGLLNMNAEQLARGLGYFSLGLGLSEFLAPRAIAKISGLDEKDTGTIRLMGLREIFHGLAIFAQGRRPKEAVWSSVRQNNRHTESEFSRWTHILNDEEVESDE